MSRIHSIAFLLCVAGVLLGVCSIIASAVIFIEQPDAPMDALFWAFAGLALVIASSYTSTYLPGDDE